MSNGPFSSMTHLRAALLAIGLCVALNAAEPYPALANQTWEGLGSSSADSMPLGNGDLALNVWTEASGDLVLYLAKTDAWYEESESAKGVGNPWGLAKVARIRISLTPNPFTKGVPVRQRLLLPTGEIELTSGGPDATSVKVWVDANHPVVRIEATAATPFTLTAGLDAFRRTPSGRFTNERVQPTTQGGLLTVARSSDKAPAALRTLTFGAVLSGAGLAPAGDALRSTAPGKSQTLLITALTAKTPTIEAWQEQVSALAAALPETEAARTAHRQWWADFWNRSQIVLHGDAKAEAVGTGYILQRFITACAGRGAYPIKFNGSLFTVDNPAHKFGKDKATGVEQVQAITGDFRAWGGQYWFQNTRAMYWPRLAAGDIDLMRPLFRMYTAQLAANAAQVKEFYGHEGAYLAETAPFWGGIPKIKPGEAGGYTKHYFTPVLELSAMLLDAYAYTGDASLVREHLLPLATAGLTFFSQHFPRETDGTLRIEPANAIEMYWIVRNPLPDIAGLHWVLTGLLALPEPLVPAAQRAAWTKLKNELPPIPRGAVDGQQRLLPYAPGQEAKARNFENPELYAVFPFRHYGVGKPDLEVARATFAKRIHQGRHCWGQDPMQAALLGLADEAKKQVTFNLTKRDPRLKFPAFWEAGHDYMPDQDNGGNGENGLQLMLLQCEGQRIHVLPAWPAGWDAEFKLNAPGQTVVEGRVAQGKLVSLTVTPAARRADVVVGVDARPAP